MSLGAYQRLMWIVGFVCGGWQLADASTGSAECEASQSPSIKNIADVHPRMVGEIFSQGGKRHLNATDHKQPQPPFELPELRTSKRRTFTDPLQSATAPHAFSPPLVYRSTTSSGLAQVHLRSPKVVVATGLAARGSKKSFKFLQK